METAMPKFALTDARIVAGGADLSSHSNTVELSAEVDDQEATSFTSGGWAEVIGGLSSATVSAGGQWEAGDASKVDDATWSQINGGVAVPWTVSPSLLEAGSLAYSLTALPTSYTVLGDVGAVAPWEAEAAGSGALVRAVVEVAPTALVASGASTGRQLTVPAGKALVATVHVLALAGTLSIDIESAPDGTWTDTEVRSTYAPTGPGATVIRVAGPVADSYWRAAWTLAGTAQVVVTLGVA
ncbi:hypothetical protein [Saccharopolyspora hattusasensis]|uniref:hypothetical protein n=1 Tax=Saccharopolyspora hattusasensis TaxID=1128679 RepID=UPI003D999B51